MKVTLKDKEGVVLHTEKKYCEEDIVVEIDKENLSPEYIKEGATILGVEGNYKGIDTSDATATPADICMNKTAYVNGEKIVGELWEAGQTTFVATDIKDTGSRISVSRVMPQDYLFRENGTIIYDVYYENMAKAIGLTPEKLAEGNTVLGVAGNFKGSDNGGVKLFETEEEMQADENVNVDDLALVYRSEIQNAKVDSKFSQAKFPKTVVLPQGMTDYVNIMYRATDDSIMFDCWGQLDSNYFMMDCYTETEEIRIEYESSDGITYTRIDGGEETIDFGTEIYYYYTDRWNDAVGYFIQTGSSYFGGLFEYAENIADYDYFPIYKSGTASYDGSTIAYDMNDEYTNGLNDLFDFINSKLSGASGILVLEDYDGETATKATLYKGKSSIYLDDAGTICVYSNIFNADTAVTTETFAQIHHFDITAGTYTTSSVTMEAERVDGGGQITVIRDLKDVYYTRIALATGNLEDITVMTKNNATYFVSTTKKQQPKMVSKYVPADSQLTLSDVNQLIPNVTAYGKTGVITGNGSIYENLDDTILVEKCLKTTMPEYKNYEWVYEGPENYLVSANINANGTEYMSHKPDAEILDTLSSMVTSKKKLVYSDDICYLLGYTYVDSLYTFYAYRINTATKEIKVCIKENLGNLNFNSNPYNCDENGVYVFQANKLWVFDFTDTPMCSSVYMTETYCDGIICNEGNIYVVCRKYSSRGATVYQYLNGALSTYMTITNATNTLTAHCTAGKYYVVQRNDTTEYKYDIYDISTKTLVYSYTPDSAQVNTTMSNTGGNRLLYSDGKLYYDNTKSSTEQSYYIDLINGSVVYVTFPTTGTLYNRSEEIYFSSSTTHKLYTVDGTNITPLINANVQNLLCIKDTNNSFNVPYANNLVISDNNIQLSTVYFDSVNVCMITYTIYMIQSNVELDTNSNFIFWKNRSDSNITMLAEYVQDTISPVEYEEANSIADDILGGAE